MKPGIRKQAGLRKGAAVTGHVVVFAGDDESGYLAHSPDLPGVAADSTRGQTESLMAEAMAAHAALLREAGKPVPGPAGARSVTIPDPAAA
jgi:predicted RNase H-like HicB family nuclease